jgi:ankyrin repeat protein
MRVAIVISALLLTACRTPWNVEDDDLTLAVRSGDVARTRALLASGADPNRPVGVNGWPPLMHAVHKNQLETAAALIDRGASIDKGGPEGMTPLMMAAGYGNDDMVDLLLRRGADPRVKAKDGATALDFAITGVSDIDKFTLFQCQESTVSLLVLRRPELHGTATAASRAWGRMKRCATS